jgi:hypothetical protein
LIVQGKGFYIWQISRCEGGNAQAIGNAAVASGLSHVLIKIADGTSAYNIVNGVDLVPPVVSALRARGISPMGWHYVYGYNPEGEADIAIQRLNQLGLDAYIVDAEAQYKEPGKEVAAHIYMQRLRNALPDFPMALSTYRFPTYHPAFPFEAFLTYVDVNMPQVYWVLADNPGEQLVRCVREYEAIAPYRPIIPTGSAYIQGDWRPTPDQIIEFMQTAQTLNLSAANFWEWGHTRLYAPELWDTVAAYNWPPGGPVEDITVLYINALNSHNVEQVVALYNANAVHVTSERTVKGLDAIRAWYGHLLTSLLPGATFSLVEVTSRLGSRRFTWTATSSAGAVTDGSDAFGLVAGKITYHYTHFTIS